MLCYAMSCYIVLYYTILQYIIFRIFQVKEIMTEEGKYFDVKTWLQKQVVPHLESMIPEDQAPPAFLRANGWRNKTGWVGSNAEPYAGHSLGAASTADTRNSRGQQRAKASDWPIRGCHDATEQNSGNSQQV